VAENVMCEKKFFLFIGPTCVGSMNHCHGTFELPQKIMSYLGAIQRILPQYSGFFQKDISTHCKISRCNTIYTM